jgi:hypothetical protein
VGIPIDRYDVEGVERIIFKITVRRIYCGI